MKKQVRRRRSPGADAHDLDAHDLEVITGAERLIVDLQPRGGLLIQVGVQRGKPSDWLEGFEWNFMQIPKRHVAQLKALLRRAR